MKSVKLDRLTSPIEGQITRLTVTVKTDAKDVTHSCKWSVDGRDPVCAPVLLTTTVGEPKGSPPTTVTKYEFDWAVEVGLDPTTLTVTVEEVDAAGNVVDTEPDSWSGTISPASMASHKATARAQSVGRMLGTAFVAKAQQGSIPVSLQRSASVGGSQLDETLWLQILATTRAIAFGTYADWLEQSCLCTSDSTTMLSGTKAYDKLKECTETFTKERCVLDPSHAAVKEAATEALTRLGRTVTIASTTEPFPNVGAVQDRVPLASEDLATYVWCWDANWRRLCLVELIWSYWHEEAMLVQTMKAISRRFQNRRAPLPRDPLANVEIDPLRPLANVLWGYVGDEVHRLSVVRRAHEYEHHYGLSLEGNATAGMRPADRRSKFLSSFHNLLHACVVFYRSDDDNTVQADGFPVLNAIKETHYVIAHGAHNQFGDLPETARQEMLIEQWILARPEMRDFLRGRAMVPYPEPWMDAVDTMKTLQGWTDTSVIHFRDLGVFGEQLILSIRYGSWATQTQALAAVAWARFWRTEVQGYIHAYRAATGVDLTADITSTQMAMERDIPPSVHLRRRLAGRAVR